MIENLLIEQYWKFRCKIFRKHARTALANREHANARLATDFHQNHATSPLAVFCSGQFRATVLG
jgi:hypothetical protein